MHLLEPGTPRHSGIERTTLAKVLPERGPIAGENFRAYLCDSEAALPNILVQ